MAGRPRGLRRVAALLVGALATAGLVASAAPASADGSALLSITSYTGMAVDPVHRRVFVSTMGGIVVRGFDASPVGLVALPATKVTSMVLSADSSSLYAVLPVTKAVVRISTTTLAVVSTYSLTSSCPRTLALAAGTLYVGYGCTSPRHVARLTVTGTTATLGPPLEGDFPSAAPEIEADPTGRWLVAASGGADPPVLMRWDLSVTPPTALTTTDFVATACVRPSLSVGDGELVSTCVSSASAVGLSPADFSPTTAYPAGSFAPGGVAVSSTAVAVAGSFPSADVLVFPRGSTIATRHLDFPDTTAVLAADGLASTPDGSYVFAVSRSSSSSSCSRRTGCTCSSTR